MSLKHARVLGALGAAAMLAAPLCARPASTSLHRCGDETCLVIAGHRDDAAAPIVIAGHEVAVEGGRRWRAAVPLRTVREWSSPFARSIAVAVGGEGGGEVQAVLPIGLFSHATALAFLDVSAR